MGFYVYDAPRRAFLADDEKSWTPSLHSAAVFATRELAEDISARELGEDNASYVFDDGIEES